MNDTWSERSEIEVQRSWTDQEFSIHSKGFTMASKVLVRNTNSTQIGHHQWCETRMDVRKLSFVWVINNFSLRPERVGSCLRSATFAEDENSQLKWYLEVFPRGDDDSRFVSVYLFLATEHQSGIVTKYKLELQNSSEKRKVVKEYSYTFDSDSGHGTSKLVRRDELMDKELGFLPDDKFVLLCEIQVIKESTTEYMRYIANPRDLTNCDATDDFKKLYDSRRLSDVVLKVDGKEIQAHKAILAARSPVFAAMFEEAMNDNQKNEVEITDFEYDIICDLVLFLYTEKRPKLGNVCKILAAADKFCVTRLKSVCEELLAANLTAETATDVLVLSDLHGCDRLKTYVTEYIILHVTEVLNTTGWKFLEKNFPHFGCDVLRALTEKQVSDVEYQRKSHKT